MVARNKPQRWNGSVPGQQDQRERKRVAILHAAAERFATRGYHETSLDDIATYLHVTKPTLYYYVRSKEEMLAQIAAEAVAGVEACHADAVRDGGDALERLGLFVRGYVAMMDTAFGRCLLAIRHTRVSKPTLVAMEAGFRRIDALARGLVEAGIREGSIAPCDARVATFVLFGAANWVPHWLRAGGALDAAHAGDAVFAILARGLASDGRRAG